MLFNAQGGNPALACFRYQVYVDYSVLFNVVDVSRSTKINLHVTCCLSPFVTAPTLWG